jgi:hypothetical protein
MGEKSKPPLFDFNHIALEVGDISKLALIKCPTPPLRWRRLTMRPLPAL